MNANIVLLWEGMKVSAKVYEYQENDRTLVDEFEVIKVNNSYTNEAIEVTPSLKAQILEAYLCGETYTASGKFLNDPDVDQDK